MNIASKWAVMGEHVARDSETKNSLVETVEWHTLLLI
jgi:hypothetical protein